MFEHCETVRFKASTPYRPNGIETHLEKNNAKCDLRRWRWAKFTKNSIESTN